MDSTVTSGPRAMLRAASDVDAKVDTAALAWVVFGMMTVKLMMVLPERKASVISSAAHPRTAAMATLRACCFVASSQSVAEPDTVASKVTTGLKVPPGGSGGGSKGGGGEGGGSDGGDGGKGGCTGVGGVGNGEGADGDADGGGTKGGTRGGDGDEAGRPEPASSSR